MKLRFQLALLMAAAIVASLAVAMRTTISLTRSTLEEEAHSAANDAVEDIAKDLQRLPPVSDEAIERRLEQALRKHRRLTDIELELEAGDKDVSQYSLRAKSDALVKRHVEALLHSGPRTISRSVGENGVRTIDVSVPLEGRIGRGRLNATLSLETVDRVIETQARITTIVAAVAVLLAALFAALIADVLVGRPLARLALTMGEVSQGALDRRVATRGPPEVRTVSKAFNRMLDRLQEADRAVRSFNERLASEVAAATQTLCEQNAALNQLNLLLARTREDLAHRERLAALGQLAAQLAHEIGTPLGSVSGHLQLALASPDTTPQTRERLVIASQEIQRVSRIIRDYLDSTRRMDPEVSDVDVERTIREAVDVARGGHPQRGAKVAVEVVGDVQRWRTDEGVVRQILVNLVANALDALAQKEGEGAVTVRASGEERSTVKGGAGLDLVLKVSDTGIGLSGEQLGRMFEPFYTTKGRGKGTGLGLAICRELAQALGGRIEAASEPGRGTTFTVRIPNGDEVVRRVQAAAGAKQAAGALH